MIIRYLFSNNLKALTKSIEQFKLFKQMSKEEARNQQQFSNVFNQLLDNLKSQSLKEKKLINISEKIEKKVFYYLSNDEQEEIYKVFSQIYFLNLEISRVKQFAIIIKYSNHLNNILKIALKHPLDQDEIFDIISAINFRNSWSQIEPELIIQLKQQLDQIQMNDQEIDYNLYNELVIASQSINIDSIIKRNLKSKKINKIYRLSQPITITHINIINRILGDELMSDSLWKHYQEDILNLPLQTLAQQQFVFDHLRRNYQLNATNQQKCDHPSLNPDRLSNMYKNQLIKEIENNLTYLNQINIEGKFENFNIEDFSKLNQIILKIKYEKSNEQFIYSYLSAMLEEIKFYIENNIYTTTENLYHFIIILNSLDGMYGLKIQKKQDNPVFEMFRIIEEKIFQIICKNNYELDLNEDQDPFAVDLLKSSKQKSGKWKEEDDQVKINISELETEQIYQLYQLALLYNKNQKGRLYFHYCITKQLAFNIKKLKFSEQCDILQYLSKIDKLFMIQDYQVDYNQLSTLNSLEQTKCAAQLLYFNQISFNIEKTIIGNLIDILHKNLSLITQLDKECQIAFYLAYELMRMEFPSIETQQLPFELKQTFEDYWLYLQKETESIVSDTKAFLDKQQYHYSHKCQVSIWKFLYVFEQDKVVVICLSNRFYLGSTNQNLVEVAILKRALRLIDYKLRILDRHEYSKLSTRHDKNNYIYEKLKYLSKEPKQPKKHYFNI